MAKVLGSGWLLFVGPPPLSGPAPLTPCLEADDEAPPPPPPRCLASSSRMSSISPPTSCTSRLRRVISLPDSPYCEGSDSTARTDSTRSAKSSASDDRADSRSVRAEASSGDEAAVVRERMRRYDAKSGRADASCARTSLLRRPQCQVIIRLIGSKGKRRRGRGF